MEGNREQTEGLMGNEAVQDFLKLLMENSPDKGQDYSMMLWQMEGIGRQLDAALQELNKVKIQLAEMQENPEKRFASRAVSAAEGRLHAIRERMAEIKNCIVEGAKEAAEGFQRTGVKALDKAVSTLGIKKALEQARKELGEAIADVKKSIGKIETIGHELRSVGGHIKNVGRTIAGKEQQRVDGGAEGRFQAAVLAPLRMEKTILTKLNNMMLAAIGNVERLEQAAGSTKEESIPETGQAGELDTWSDLEDCKDMEPSPEKKPEKGKEKPSLLKELQEGKAQASAQAVHAPDKEKDRKETALLLLPIFFDLKLFLLPVIELTDIMT